MGSRSGGDLDGTGGTKGGGSAIYPFRFEHHVALDGLDDACAS